MKVFAVALVAAVLLQVAFAAPGRKSSSSPSCGCGGDSDEAKGGSSRPRPQKPVFESSEEEESDEGCAQSGPSRPSRPSRDESSEEASSGSDDCTQVDKAQVVRTSRPCEENEKIYLHRQAPIYVRPPPSRIFINHPPVIVRQPPVILHHQSRSPVIVKPILIKEREVAARPVMFKISKPDSQVSVSPCENPKVTVNSGAGAGYGYGSGSGAGYGSGKGAGYGSGKGAGSGSGSGSGCSNGNKGACSRGCTCARKEKDC